MGIDLLTLKRAHQRFGKSAIDGRAFGIVSVSEFGDDGQAIQEALDSAPPGSIVLMEAGHTYVTEQTIWIPGNVTLAGQGPDTVIKLADAPFRNLTRVYSRAEGGQNFPILANRYEDTAEMRKTIQTGSIRLQDFTLVGNTDARVDYRITGILISSAENCTIRNVRVRDINFWDGPVSNGGFGVMTQYSRKITIENLDVERCQYEGLGIFDGSETVTVINLRAGVAGRTSAQVHRGTRDVTFMGGICENSGTLDPNEQPVQAMTVHGTDDLPVHNLRLLGITLRTTGDYAGKALSAFGRQENTYYDIYAESDGAEAVLCTHQNTGYIQASLTKRPAEVTHYG